MVHVSSFRKLPRLDLSFWLAVALVALLWLAGGASRADALGQAIVRSTCCGLVVVAILAGPRPKLAGLRPVLWLLLATIALPLLQLVPLPPQWWQALPGRGDLLVPGEAAPWRPLTMSPGATRNALASLIVPAAVLLLLMQAEGRARRTMLGILIVMMGSAMVLGLLQFSGARFNNPFINDTPGLVSGIFANRNHFALFLSVGCLLTPGWALLEAESMRWRGPLAVGLVILFALTILATGSRAGILLGTLALGLAMLLLGRRLRHRLRGRPAWLLPAFAAAAAVVFGGLITLSFLADRADAINRFLSLDTGGDLRTKALPTILGMIGTYMPFGSGMGSFDPVFRIHEPFELLKFTYLNQAHNDYLGIALDGGVAGILILAAGIIWWLFATVRVFRAKAGNRVLLGRLGSATIFLVLVASVTDYPARTPSIMALLVIAAVWLSEASSAEQPPTLPS